MTNVSQDGGEPRAAARPRLFARLVAFVAACLAAILWVQANDGEHASAARHFLRELLRRMF